MKEGAQDTAIAMSSRLTVLVVSLAIQSLLAWLLGPEGRGAYAVCLLFATLLAMVFTLGVDRGGQYFAASGKLSPAASITSAVVLLAIGSVVGVGVGRAIMATNAAFLSRADHSSFIVALALVPVVAFQNAFVTFLVGLRRFGWMAVVEVANVVAQLAAALVLVRVLGLGVNGALLSIAAAGLVSSMLAVRYLRRSGALAWRRQEGTTYRAITSYGLRYFVAKLSNLFHFRIDTMLLAFFVGSAEIGIFAAASSLVTRILLIPNALERALFSRVAAHRAGRPELIAQAARISGIVAGVALGLLVVLSEPLVRVLLSPSFLPALPLIWIIAPGVLVRAASKVLMPYFMGTNRPSICSWSVGIGTLANVAAQLVLLPSMGLRGAAVAMTTGYAISGVMLVLAFRRASGLKLLETWAPRRADVALLFELMGHLRRRGATPGGPAPHSQEGK
jgi:O-antigen/teichoic acid export membrane protein